MKKALLILIFLNSILFAQTGNITGIVLDATNNQPVVFANIQVLNTDLGVVTDFDGKFKIEGLKAGYASLKISYIGYTNITTEVLVTKNNSPYIEVLLESNGIKLEEVTIQKDRFKKVEEAPLSMQSITTREIESNPGSNRDISKVIQSFPGVGSTPAFRNDIIIRGGGPSENRFYLDGIEIPVLNHFSTQGASGGPVGIINADFIRSVDFYAGSFPARTNNALSGVLDFKLKEGNKERINTQIAVGASEASLTFEGPINKNTTFIASYRRSYLEFLFAALGLPFLPTFNDYQVKIKTKIDDRNTFTFLSLGSLDNLRINDGIVDPSPSQEFILSQIAINNQWSYTIGGIYKNFFDKGSHNFYLSRNMLNNEVYKYPDNDETKARSLDYLSTEAENKFRYEYNLRDKGYKVNFSTNLEYARYTNSTEQQIFVNNQLQNLSFYTSLNLFKYGLSGQVSKKYFNNRLLVSLGVRFDGNNFNDNMKNLLNQTSPRVALSYAIKEKTRLNAGFGRYFQLPSYLTLGHKNNTGNLANTDAKYIGSNHYTIGVEHKFSKKINVSVEGFYKDYFQYPIDIETGASIANQGAGFGVVGASDVIFNGKGRAFGGEALVRLNLKNLNLLAAYTYVRSAFTDINGDYVPSAWDSEHLLSLTASYNLPWNFRAGLKWRFVGGLPYTPYDDDKSKNIEAWNSIGGPYLDYDRLNTERFQPFHQLDVRVDKNFFFKKWSLMVYLDLQNAYNFQNEGQPYIIRQKDTNGNYITTDAAGEIDPNGQNYSLESIDNIGGTILPTLGIMVKF
ncbi:MAG: hypothetical protein ACI8ZX_000267 [Planctomycetota bacterium]|jgi:hypothetical protein